MKGYIYSLHKRHENDIFYIGATVNHKQRIISHRGTFPYYKFDCRIGLSIIEEIDIENWNDLLIHEAYWIQQFVAWGFNLVNYNLHYGVDIRHLKDIIEIENGIF